MRGGPRDRGWKHWQKSCPVVGMGTGVCGGVTSLLAPFLAGGPGRLRAPPPTPVPRRGERRGSGGAGGAPSPSYRGVPASRAAVLPVPRRGEGGGGVVWERGTPPPNPAVLGRSGLQLVPLCHRLPGTGDHVLPVLHLPGAALPGQVDLRGQSSFWQPPLHGTSIPILFPGAAAFAPRHPRNLLSPGVCRRRPPVPRSARCRALFKPSICRTVTRKTFPGQPVPPLFVVPERGSLLIMHSKVINGFAGYGGGARSSPPPPPLPAALMQSGDTVGTVRPSSLGAAVPVPTGDVPSGLCQRRGDVGASVPLRCRAAAAAPSRVYPDLRGYGAAAFGASSSGNNGDYCARLSSLPSRAERWRDFTQIKSREDGFLRSSHPGAGDGGWGLSGGGRGPQGPPVVPCPRCPRSRGRCHHGGGGSGSSRHHGTQEPWGTSIFTSL